MSGLDNKQTEQSSACNCGSNSLVIELLQTMKAQNELMTRIMDQNSELMAQLNDDPEDNDEPTGKYLDDD